VRTPRPARRALVLLVIASALIAPAAAGADGGPAATATPANGLVDGQVVNVAWSGFDPGTAVYIRLCKRGATTSAQCTLPGANNDSDPSTDQGGGLVRYQVKATNFGKFQCDDTHACDLVVMQNEDDLTGAVHVQVSFAHDPTGCPTATTPPVVGEGSTSAAYTMYGWENAACNLGSHLNVTFTNDNSYDGVSHWTEGGLNTDFAVTGVPLASDQLKQLAAKHRRFSYAPLSLTAVVVAFNIVDQEGNQITHLTLTPKLVAEIAAGQLSTFDCPATVSDDDCRNVYGGDPDLRRLNPGVDFPSGSIQFSIRAEHSATNLAFTSWLTATAPDIWTYGPTTVWPPAAPHQCITCSGGVQGENNATNAVTFPFFYTAQNDYIGILDSTSAAIGDLPVATIVNPGQPETGVAPSAASLQSALSDATTNADGTLTPDYATSNPDSYPIPMLSYAAVPTSKGWPGFTADDGKTLAAFLRYLAGDGQGLLPGGSYPLTDALTAETVATALKIPTSEPVTPGGGGHHHQPTGGGGTTNFGGGGGGQTGGGYHNPGTSHPAGAPKPLPPPVPVAFTTPPATLSSSTSDAMLPSLVLALVALLVGPAVWLRSREPGGGRLRPALSAWRPRRPFRRIDQQEPPE
jgi:phosphate transport system substrate-binding protein